MDIWETLRANSDAPEGSDFWTLIQTQNTGTGSGNTVDGICISADKVQSYIVETDEGHTIHTVEYVTILKETELDVQLDTPNTGPTVLTESEEGGTISTVRSTTVVTEVESERDLEGANGPTILIDTRD